jgi:uncharacterized protein
MLPLWFLLLDLAAPCTAADACGAPAFTAEEAPLESEYQATLAPLPAAAQPALRAQHLAWLNARRACAGETDPGACRAALLPSNRAVLDIATGRVPVFAAVTYRCPAAPFALAASYYRSDPAAVRLRYGAAEIFAFVARSASGARYVGPDVELWEHQGIARLTWHGTQQECPQE